jgi:hypothetical protein
LFTLGKFDSTQDENGLFSFTDTEDVIGFYGAENSSAMRTLGFLIKNEQCVVDKLGEGVLDGDDSDDSDSLILIIVVVVVGIIVIAIVSIVIVHLCCRKKQRSTKVHAMRPEAVKGKQEYAGEATANNSIPQMTDDAVDPKMFYGSQKETERNIRTTSVEDV